MNANKVALITGANKGLGLEISRQLGQQGIAVVLGSRDLARGQAAAGTLRAEGIDARAAQLDITNADDIAAVPAFLEQSFGRLDILVNNAGVLTEHQGITPEAFRQGYEANVIGPYFLIQALLPLLQAAPAGRIVNQSSILGSLATNASDQTSADWLLPVYNSSKAALNMLTVIQAQLLKNTRIKVNAAHPGSVQTDMNQAGTLTTAQGAQSAVLLATLPDDGPTGGFFHDGKPLPW